MKEKLDGRTVLITGASSGIGEEFAKQLADKGCRLILLARREDRLEKLVNSLPVHEQGHIYFKCDVGDYDQVKSCCEQILDQNILPDVLILNAGYSQKFDVRSFKSEPVKRMMDVHFFGAIYFLEFFLPQMIERNSGHVVFMASLAGFRGMPKAGPYSAAKAALGVFLESLRVDLYQTNLNFTLLSPGFIETPLTTKNEFPMPFIMPLPKAVRKMIKGIERKKCEVHLPGALSIPAKMSRFLPYRLYASIMSRQRK